MYHHEIRAATFGKISNQNPDACIFVGIQIHTKILPKVAAFLRMLAIRGTLEFCMPSFLQDFSKNVVFSISDLQQLECETPLFASLKESSNL